MIRSPTAEFACQCLQHHWGCKGLLDDEPYHDRNAICGDLMGLVFFVRREDVLDRGLQ